MIKNAKIIQAVLSFDTTGSMYPCLTQVRREIEKTTRRLFRDVQNLQIGIIAHGDYYDGPRAIQTHEFSTNVESLSRFIQNVRPTNGGDAPECYELALHTARTSFAWSKNADSRVLVMVGDDVPHGPNYPSNTKRLDWRKELQSLLGVDTTVYGVQCLNRSHATPFWREIAETTGGFHLTLDQFASVNDLLMAICYRQQGIDPLERFQQEVISAGKMDRGLDAAFGTLSGRREPSCRFTSVDASLRPVPVGRFQVLPVDADQKIRDFVEENGLIFQTGRGFYELTKPVLVQENKEVILMDCRTGDKYTGDEARRLIGAPPGTRVKVKPGDLGTYVAFVQSTSYNRKLIGGTRFLYEVDLSR